MPDVTITIRHLADGSYSISNRSYSVGAPTLHEALALAARYEELAALPAAPGGFEPYRSTPDEARIRAAMSTMPYGTVQRVAGVHQRYAGPGVTLRMVADYLEALRDVLKEAIEGNHRAESELLSLKRDLAAVRRVLGTGE